jgi:hypothetical protein
MAAAELIEEGGGGGIENNMNVWYISYQYLSK